MSSAKPIQLILARQLASSLAMPILLVDTEGTLVYYNEPAEAILNHRFEETGEVSADEVVEMIELTDEDLADAAGGFLQRTFFTGDGFCQALTLDGFCQSQI